MKDIQQVIRYLIGGGSTAIINWSLVYIFVEFFRFHYLASMNSAIFIIYLYSYFINKYFVFNNYEKKHVRHGVG
ncbi:GtrA family protein, partial [Vibrio sp. 10N.222.45.F7]